MAEQVSAPLLYPINDAREALGGLGRTTFFELLKSGRLRSVRVGKRRFVPADALAEFVEQLEADQNAEGVA